MTAKSAQKVSVVLDESLQSEVFTVNSINVQKFF